MKNIHKLIQDEIWSDIRNTLDEGQSIEIFKNVNKLKILEVNENSILVRVLSTGNEPKLSKRTFDNIISKLIENDQINQGKAGSQPRITLAILHLLPYFEIDTRIVDGESKQCLVWSRMGREKFLKINR